MAGDLEAGELQGQDLAALPASASLEQRMEGGEPREYHQRPRAGHRFRSGAPLRGTKKKARYLLSGHENEK